MEESWGVNNLAGAESNWKNQCSSSKSHRHGDKATLSKLSPVAFSHFCRCVFRGSRSTKLRSLELSAMRSSAVFGHNGRFAVFDVLPGKTLPAAVEATGAVA